MQVSWYTIDIMLHMLPMEVAWEVMSYLPLQLLHRVALVSRTWKTLIAMNESSIYHKAAILHRFTDTKTAPHDADIRGMNWKSYC